MANEKPLTRKDLIEALKDLPTKEDVRQIVSEEITARGLATKADVQRVEAKMLTMERSLKRRMGKHRNEIMAALGKIATSTPTKKEFDDLKEKVELLHPAQ